jgi:stress response protein YsnF
MKLNVIIIIIYKYILYNMSSLNSNSGYFDSINSSIFPLDTGESFNGSYSSCLNFSVIEISVKCDSTFTLTIYYSSNTTSDDFEITETQVNLSSDALFYKFEPKMRYYRISLTNTGDNQTFLNLQTLLKSSLTYQDLNNNSSNVVITDPLNQDGSVFVGGTVDISGQTVIVDISGQTVDISGQTVDISGQTVDISGQTVIVDISGQTVDISGQTVDISGQTVIVDISGQAVDISGQTVDISGQTVDISGQTVIVDISGQAVDISGQTVDISGQTVDISGQTVVVSNLSNKGATILWSNALTGVNGFSSIADLSNINQLNLTFYGSVNGATSLVVQFSNDGTNFYDSQYSYTLSGSGNWGFNINSSPLYVRLKSTNSITAYAFVNYY